MHDFKPQITLGCPAPRNISDLICALRLSSSCTEMPQEHKYRTGISVRKEVILQKRRGGVKLFSLGAGEA